MLDHISIAQAQAQDIQELAILFDLYRQFYARPSNLIAAQTFLRERILKQESQVLVARLPAESAQILGFVQLYPSFSSLSLRPYWILSDLFVAPTQRGKMIGRQLMLSAYELAKAAGAVGLSLQTSSQNLVAQKLYESLGWRRDEQFFSYDRRVE